MINSHHKEGTHVISEEHVERLRLILEASQLQAVSFAEALTIGDAVIEFFKVLSSEQQEYEMRVG